MFKNLYLFSQILCFFLISWTLSAQPDADFYFELPEGPDKFTAPVKVDFTNATFGHTLEYNWTLNGQSFSIEEEPSQIFLQGGKYEVCLEAKDQAGHDRICQTLEFFDPKAEVISAAIQ